MQHYGKPCTSCQLHEQSYIKPFLGFDAASRPNNAEELSPYSCVFLRSQRVRPEHSKIGHEEIGNRMDSPREVVTRMLGYSANEGTVKRSRGTV